MNIDLAQFKKDFYDPYQRVTEVAEKYEGLNQYNISTFVRSLGWKNRREAGIIYKPNGMPDRDTLVRCLDSHTMSQAAKHFNMAPKTINKILADENGIVRLKRVGGCNPSCPNWCHCTTIRPEVLPCEVHFFEDEFIEMDEDSVSYYHSPDLGAIIKIGS